MSRRLREIKRKEKEAFNDSRELNKKGLIFGFIFFILLVSVLSFWNTKSLINSPWESDRKLASLTNNDNFDHEIMLELLQEIDSDGDGLSDYDEIYIYNTSPYLEDSDGDGISDYDEVMQGTDPNCPEGQNCHYQDDIEQGEYEVPDSSSPNYFELSANEEFLGVMENSELELIMSGQASPSQLRSFLLQSGFEEAALKQLSDEDIVEVYQDILDIK